MTFQRSHAHAELGHQLYPVLEQCRKPEVLWMKLATGNYDWLGVRRNGRYVLGRPRLSAVVQDDSGTAPNDADHPHRMECLGPLQVLPRWEAFATAEDARDAYRRLVAGDPVTPLRDSGVWKVRLFLGGLPVEERLVVRTLPKLV